MKIIALLPMKGHSERVPNKNMRDFDGKPLYHAIMQVLEKSEFISEVIINTDSEIIEKDALVNFSKVKIHKRPSDLQGDFVSMNKIIEFDLQNSDGDIYVQTHSTNPLLTVETFNKGIQYFIDNQSEIDSVFSVTKMQTRLYWQDGKAINHNPSELIRTQDLPPVFEENSNFFIFTKESFKNSEGKRIGVNPGMAEVNKLEAIDIDVEEDFELAEILYSKK